MKGRAQKWLNIGLAVTLLVFVLLVQSLEPAGTQEAEDPSLGNYADPGRRAAYLLLEQLGFGVEPWQLPPSALPRGGATIVMPDVPRSVFGRESSSDLPDSPLAETAGQQSSLDIHLPVHYRRFLDAGGVLFASAEEGMLKFLATDLKLSDVQDLTRSEVESAESVLTSGGRLVVDSTWQFDGDLPEAFSVWAVADNGAPQIVSLAAGRGELVLFADNSLLSNAALRDGDEGLLLVRAIEEFDRSGRILFDEYSLGRWSPQSSTELAFSGRFVQLTVQLLVLLALFVWRLGWVGRFPRDPEPFELLSPLSRVRAQAHLIERAERYDLLGRWLVDGVIKRAMKAWRVDSRRNKEPSSSRQDLEQLGKRMGLDSNKWSATLCDAKIYNEATLARLEVSLSEFEREVVKSSSTWEMRGKVKRAI